MEQLISTFQKVMKEVEQKFDSLVESEKFLMKSLPREIPTSGIYLISEQGRDLYVGRSNSIRIRLQYHTRNNHNQATFAFLLAREETGKTKASYQKDGSRKDLLKQPAFRASFDQARLRIKNMNVQVIEEIEPVKQALLEIYTAFNTKSKYNDFDNH